MQLKSSAEEDFPPCPCPKQLVDDEQCEQSITCSQPPTIRKLRRRKTVTLQKLFDFLATIFLNTFHRREVIKKGLYTPTSGEGDPTDTGTTSANLLRAGKLTPLTMWLKNYCQLRCQLPSHLLVKNGNLPSGSFPHRGCRSRSKLRIKLDRKATEDSTGKGAQKCGTA